MKRFCVLIIPVVTTVLFVGVALNAHTMESRQISINEQRDLIGGVCNTKCITLCSNGYFNCSEGGNGDGNCYSGATYGELCHDSGTGGEVTVKSCGSTTASTECEQSGDAKRCTPDTVCICDNDHECVSESNTSERSGKGECNTGGCGA